MMKHFSAAIIPQTANLPLWDKLSCTRILNGEFQLTEPWSGKIIVKIVEEAKIHNIVYPVGPNFVQKTFEHL